MRGQAACGGGEREEGERGEREEGERGEREREGGRKERLATHRSGCNLYPVFLFWVLGGFQQLRGETDFWQKRRREGRDAGNKYGVRNLLQGKHCSINTIPGSVLALHHKHSKEFQG